MSSPSTEQERAFKLREGIIHLLATTRPHHTADDIVKAAKKLAAYVETGK